MEYSRDRHLPMLASRLGLPIDPSVWIGSGTRKDRSAYTQHFDDRMNRDVCEIFREDLDLLGYAFGRPHPTNVIETPRAAQAAA